MAQLTGVQGRLERGYFVAATIEGYTVTQHDGQWSLTAKLVTADAYQLTQRPLMFVAGPRDTWRWAVLTCTVTNGRLSAQLAPMTAAGSGNACRDAPRP